MTREFLDVYGSLLKGEAVHVKGKHITIEDGRILYPPAQDPRPPFCFDGSSNAGITAPGRYGAAGAGTTWLVGSAQEVAESLWKYRDLGIQTFILSDTPCLSEIERQGRLLLPPLDD